MDNFATNANCTTWWSKLEPMLICSWRANSSERGNTLGPLCLWQCLQDNVTHEKNTLKTYWRQVLPIYSYQPMVFLQCDVIVSPQCTKKSACITALVTCAVKHAPSLVHWGDTMTSHWRKANFYKIISCFAWMCILKSLSEEASIPHMAQEGMATANSV